MNLIVFAFQFQAKWLQDLKAGVDPSNVFGARNNYCAGD
jgi:hypothetical protein